MDRHIAPWVVLASQQLIHDRWIDLRADTCVTAEGRTVSPFYVLHQPDWVVIVPLSTEGAVILVEEYHHGVGETLIGLPGGGIEPGESPIDAAQRELLEETGYGRGRAESLGWCHANWGNQTNRVHFVAIQGCTRLADPTEAGVVVHLRPLPEVLRNPPSQSFHMAALYSFMTKQSDGPST